MKTLSNVVAVLCLFVVLSRVLSNGGIDILPTPIPSPKPGSWVVLVEETQDRNNDTAKLLADSQWMEALKARQLKFRAYDDDQPEAASYLPTANTVGLPAVIVVAPDGKVLGSFKLPSDRAELDRRIKEAAGL